MGAGPRRPVEAPRARAPIMGLLASAARPDDADDRWQNGLHYEPEDCYNGDTPTDPCGDTEKDDPEAVAEADWEPYIVSAAFRCSTMGFAGRDWRGVATRRLNASQGFQIERELWTGTLATSASFPNLHLADVTTVDILTESGAVGLTHGLACLTQALAENNAGAQGMIHATPQVVTHWAGLDLLYRRGDVLLTLARDDIVVPGAGYTGGDPDGNDAESGDVWAYATDVVEVRLGDVMVTGDPLTDPVQVDRTNNIARVRAERLALASWQGCRHFGARMDVSICDISGS